MGLTISKSFTGTGVAAAIAVKHNDSYTYTVSGTFSGTVVLEKTSNGGISWDVVKSITAADSATLLSSHANSGVANYRFRCSKYTSGTIVTTLAEAVAILQTFVDNSGATVFQISKAGISEASNQNTGLSTGVVHADSTGLESSSTIVDADVSATAAIAGTKISPNFGAQKVLSQAGSSVAGILNAMGILYKAAPATVGNTSSTETDLFTYTMPLNVLASNGDGIVARGAGGLANNSNSKTINVYLGANSLNLFTGTTANVTYLFECIFTRISTTTTRFNGFICVGSTMTLFDSIVTTTDLTLNTAVVKVTGTGVSTNDLNCKQFSVRFEPHA